MSDVNALSNIDFRFYLSLFMRRLPLFLIVLVIATSAGVIATVLRPIVFQATARILVESPQIPAELAKSTVPTGAAEQFQIIQQHVLSRDNLLALADRLALYQGRPPMSRAETYDDLIRRLEIAPTHIESGTGAVATVFRIAFKAGDPDSAANFVNTLVTQILDKDIQLRTGRATDTVTFFDGEAARLDQALREADSRILAFKNEHIDALPDSLDFRREQQTVEQRRLLVLAQEESMLRKQRTDLESRPLELGVMPTSPVEQNLQALRQSLVQQQALFAEDSPTIKGLRGRIAAIEGDLAGASSQPGSDRPTNARQFQIADITDRLAAIAQEREQVQRKIADLSASIARTPSNETRLNSLLRDHHNLQAQYDLAVARLAEASTGKQIELLLKGERLSLIESAVPPRNFQGFGTRMLLFASLIVGVLAGLVAVVVPEFFNRRIRRPAELTSRLQIVPYITVPYIERRIFDHRRLAISVAATLTIPVVLLVAGIYLSPHKNIIGQTQAATASPLPGVQP
ncbi:Wzz/FepE/Etk N-terminal domain-containing protein [Devosia sp. 1566]|uniref:GumC family protein n=1 Tax=Devosia sp. 1566 TaxID=2499144 RepID=UPI000FDC1148|nr:Wzz/FepE/Etk N-terminal domain-containing protein [Devosia sp. 1566]